MIPFKKPITNVPPRISIWGAAGVGKTTLAALFPKPLFITAEPNGFLSFKPEEMPNIIDIIDNAGTENNTKNLWYQLNMILNEPNITDQVQTLVIDNVSQFHQLFTDYILNREKADSLEDIGKPYNKGYGMVRGQHLRLVAKCNVINQRGIAIVYLGHDTKVTVREQNQEEYSVQSIAVGNSDKDLEYATKLYIKEDIDLSGYLKIVSTPVKTAKAGVTKVYGGNVQLICGHDVTCRAKNRLNITKPIEVKKGENPLLEYFPFFNKNKLNNKGV